MTSTYKYTEDVRIVDYLFFLWSISYCLCSMVIDSYEGHLLFADPWLVEDVL